MNLSKPNMGKPALAGALWGLMLMNVPATWADVRSDARKEGAAVMAMTLNERLGADAVDVSVMGDKAIVSGTVASEPDKALAGRLAQAVTGVATIENRLDVNPALAERPPVKPPQVIALNDLTLAATIESRLSWNTPTADSPVEVSVDGGVVTLKGQALTADAKEWAGELASSTAGAIVVNNLISLRAADTATTEAETQARLPDDGVNDAWIASKVASSFQYDRGLDALRLDVKVKEGVVSLSGEVDSQLHKTHAMAIARQIRGVRGVDADLLKVAVKASST